MGCTMKIAASPDALLTPSEPFVIERTEPTISDHSDFGMR